ncbi:MAG: dihydropteroate synthase [Solirubrobacterales bacterium]
MIIGNKEFNIGERTYIMGILNVTPDSFSDGGNFNSIDKALNRVEKMINEGADIIDIGGESTRPNHMVISAEEEINRVTPVISAIKTRFDIPISIDTYKSEVASAALEHGADMINDVWGFKKDPNMAEVAVKYDAACCLMHNRDNMDYKNFMEDVIFDIMESINIAISGGVKKEKIIVDPGIGFARNYELNLETMNNLEKIAAIGYPVLLGTSRKSMIGTALDLSVDQRLEGTLATTVIGIMKGCDFIRVHDVLENKRASVMTDKIIRRRK